MINAVKVAFESFFDFVLGLPHILFEAGLATYAVNKIVAVACYVLFGGVYIASGVTGNLSRFVEFHTVSACLFGDAFSVQLSDS